jgi:hypothetical protein
MGWRWGVALFAGVCACSIAHASPFGVKQLAMTSENTMRRESPPWLSRTLAKDPEPVYLPPLGRYGLPWEEPVFRRVDVRRWQIGTYAVSIGTVGFLQTDREGTAFAGEWLFNSVDVPGIRVRPRFIEHWELGAGLLMGFRSNFTPSSAWTLMTVGRRL